MELPEEWINAQAKEKDGASSPHVQTDNRFELTGEGVHDFWGSGSVGPSPLEVSDQPTWSLIKMEEVEQPLEVDSFKSFGKIDQESGGQGLGLVEEALGFKVIVLRFFDFFIFYVRVAQVCGLNWSERTYVHLSLLQGRVKHGPSIGMVVKKTEK